MPAVNFAFTNPPVFIEPLQVFITGAVPQLVKSGGTLNLSASLRNAPGFVTYVWEIDKRQSGVANSDSNYQLQIPEIASCDEKQIVSVIATDDRGRTAEDRIEIMVSKTWCTLLAQEDQLLSNHVTKLALGSDGKIWIGTDKGLNSFDGTILEKVTSKNSALGHSPSYREGRNYINALFVQKNKTENLDEVWTSACESENLNCVGVQRFIGDPYEKKSANWSRYSSESSKTVKVLHSAKGKLFVATSAGVEVFSLDAPEKKLNHLAKGYGINAILPNVIGSDDWYGTDSSVFSSGAIYWHNQKTKKHGWLSGANWSENRNDGVFSLIRDGDNVYIGFKNGGMVRVSDSWKLFLKKDYPSMPGDDIRKIAVGKSSIWVATKTGLGRFIPKKDVPNEGSWESAPFKSSAVKSLGGLVTDVLTDLVYDKASDTLWIGTKGGGLTRLRVGLL